MNSSQRTASEPSWLDAAPVLFVTGMQRSGTTLLDKLLDRHPDLTVLSQPFPLLFVQVKERFLAEQGIERPYPLDHYFGERDYGLDDLTRWLRRNPLTPAEVADAFDRMKDFSGQYTQITATQRAELADSIAAAPLHDVMGQLYAWLSGQPSVRFAGGKETLCEEFVPYLLGAGAHVILIIRDPRDVLCSLNHGRGDAWAGSPKPTLFNIRHWRKSVHVALAHGDDPRLHVVRYEDLVTAPAPEQEAIAQWLGVQRFPEADIANLQDQAGRRWRGNSSFDLAGGRTQSVGRYRRELPEGVAGYVEAATLPELRHLGYDTTLTVEEATGRLRSFTEPYEITRGGLEGYSEDPDNVAAELRRLEFLRAGHDLHDRSLFMDRSAAAVLAGRLG